MSKNLNIIAITQFYLDHAIFFRLGRLILYSFGSRDVLQKIKLTAVSSLSDSHIG